MPPIAELPWLQFALALAIGALVGVEREQRKRAEETGSGLRTFILVSEAGAIAAWLSGSPQTPWIFLGAGALLVERGQPEHGVGRVLRVGVGAAVLGDERLEPADAGGLRRRGLFFSGGVDGAGAAGLMATRIIKRCSDLTRLRGDRDGHVHA
jgi:hypothetical protein